VHKWGEEVISPPLCRLPVCANGRRPDGISLGGAQTSAPVHGQGRSSVNPALLDYLACPACKGTIALRDAFTILESRRGGESIKEGLLQCERCGQSYPILDEIPRMVRAESMSEEEREFLRNPPRSRKKLTRSALSEAERRAKIEETVVSRFKLSSTTSSTLRARVEHEIDYHVEKTEKKEKVFLTIYPFLSRMPTAIVDIGGGQGGLITCLRKSMNPRVAILLDYDLSWIEVARLRDPDIEVVRGDAAWLPFGEKSIDLMVTMSTLEHVPQWKRAVVQMARTSRTLFLSYGPNRNCFFDKGHLDAPVFPLLPCEVTCRISHLWHKIRGTGRTYHSILQEYRKTNYISRHRVQAILERYGKTTNVWNDFVFHSVRSDYHYVAAGAKRFLRKHYVIQALFSFLTESLGVEPNVYLILQRD